MPPTSPSSCCVACPTRTALEQACDRVWALTFVRMQKTDAAREPGGDPNDDLLYVRDDGC